MNFNTPQYAVLLTPVLWSYWASARLWPRRFLLLTASHRSYGATPLLAFRTTDRAARDLEGAHFGVPRTFLEDFA